MTNLITRAVWKLVRGPLVARACAQLGAAPAVSGKHALLIPPTNFGSHLRMAQIALP